MPRTIDRSSQAELPRNVQFFGLIKSLDGRWLLHLAARASG